MSFFTNLPTNDPARIRIRLVNNIIVNNGCWIWQGSKNKGGYGLSFIFENNQSRTIFAHRLSYEVFIGVIPKGLVIDHLCRNRSCINPEHLEPVTVKINTNRGIGSWANRLPRTYCKYGHKLTKLNTRYTSDKPGYKICRICAAKANKEYRLRRKNAIKSQSTN